MLALRSLLVETTCAIRRCRDPFDDRFLEAALDGHADRLVTRDADLLAIGSIEEVSIVTPTEFVSELD